MIRPLLDRRLTTHTRAHAHIVFFPLTQTDQPGRVHGVHHAQVIRAGRAVDGGAARAEGDEDVPAHSHGVCVCVFAIGVARFCGG